MKICAYKNPTLPHLSRPGILLDEKEVLDPNLVWAAKYRCEGRYNFGERADRKLPPSLYQILNQADSPLDLFQETLEEYARLKKSGDAPTLPSSPTLTKPLDKIATYRDCYTHEKHVAAGFKKRGTSIPEEWYNLPTYYKGSNTGFIGPGEDVLWPHYSDKLDYELELALVVGREGRNISTSSALEHVFGFTILNDISARDMQKRETTIRLGPAKGKDFCSVIGPVITTMDEYKGKEPNLLMQAFVNGEMWSKGHSGEAHFSWAEILAHASMDEWILPGDLFGSGTVGSGCGMELDKWIRPGDEIELKVESIGSLINTIGEKKRGIV